MLQSEDVTLIFEDTSAVPSIYSDEAKVSQILRNLLSNAIKFTERGSVRVWAAAEGDTVRIVVSDTGIGIPEQELPRIFEEFTQVETPLQRRVRGTGLGLPLCKKFAELLGGQLEVESTPGKGSVFTLVLPRMYPVRGDQPFKDETKRPRTRATLLIVDDIEIDRYLLSHLITASGDYDIIQAEDGQAGLQVARRERPDLIFLDVNLPLMDGYAVASELGRDPVTRGIPIFAVTAEKLSQPDYDRLCSLTRGVILKENLSEAQRVTIDLSNPAQVDLTLTSMARILIVDDVELNRYIRSEILRQAGYESLQAATAAEALEKCINEKPTWCCWTSIFPMSAVSKCAAALRRIPRRHR